MCSSACLHESILERVQGIPKSEPLVTEPEQPQKEERERDERDGERDDHARVLEAPCPFGAEITTGVCRARDVRTP